MDQIHEEVREILNQIIDNLKIEKCSEENKLFSIDLSIPIKNKEFDALYINSYSRRSLYEKFPAFEVNKVFKQKTEANPIYEFEDLCRKKNILEIMTSPNIFHFSGSHADLYMCSELKEFPIRTSTPVSQFSDQFCLKSNEKSLDKTIDEAINKYETSYTKSTKKLKDVSVQTTSNISGTTNKQCQCNLIFTDDSDFNYDESPPLKNTKLNTHEYEYSHSKHKSTASSKLQQEEGSNKRKYFGSGTGFSQIKVTGIRVGLSKRVKPPPLHIMN